MKSKKIYTFIALLLAIGFYLYNNRSSVKYDPADTSLMISTDTDYLPTSTTGQIVKHQYYTLSYNEAHEQAEWVAYRLTDNQLVYTKFKRPFFTRDNKVKTKSAHYKSYSKSGFDKGHLCPAGDRKFSKEAHNATFLTSNISPQRHDFNAGVWNRLEQKTRYWAKKYKGIYIVTGGVLKENLPTIGSDKVSVPEQFYKIILDYTEPEVKAIAFLIPHKESDDALYKFTTSIDKIEELTKIDFFPNLPDVIEDQLEASKDYKQWSFR